MTRPPIATHQPLLFLPQTSSVRITEHWHIIKDGDAAARAVFDNHYSRYRYKDGRQPKLFVGPGEKLVLATKDYSAIFAWRRYLDDWLKEPAVWCAIFRNDSEVLSSELIRQAGTVANCRWPGEPWYTYVNPAEVKSGNPGYCFKLAGYEKIGETKSGLHVLRAA